jgi:hypothetical protein
MIKSASSDAAEREEQKDKDHEQRERHDDA